MSKKYVNPAEYIRPININGMDGRLLRLASSNRRNRREILVLYELVSNLEKWWGLAIALKNYANVTMIDLPGLGGMDSFYSIGLKPSIDNMADYLASFIKLKYRRKSLSIVGIGFGFVVATRMLQRNPDVKLKVHLLIAINGYSHIDDFKLKSRDRRLQDTLGLIFSTTLLGGMGKLLTLNTPYLKAKMPSAKVKSYRNGPSADFIRRFKIDLLQATDLRTKMYLKHELSKLDNCNVRVDKDLWHITTSNAEQKTDLKLVEQHFRVIFSHYNQLPVKVGRQMPLVLTDEKMAIKYLPAKIRRVLKSQA